MSFLIITCFVCALPSLLPIVRIVNMKKLNIFDFSIFYIINFEFKILDESFVDFLSSEKCTNL